MTYGSYVSVSGDVGVMTVSAATPISTFFTMGQAVTVFGGTFVFAAVASNFLSIYFLSYQYFWVIVAAVLTAT